MRIPLTPLENMSISHTNWTESAIDLWEMDVLGGLFMFRGERSSSPNNDNVLTPSIYRQTDRQIEPLVFQC